MHCWKLRAVRRKEGWIGLSRKEGGWKARTSSFQSPSFVKSFNCRIQKNDWAVQVHNSVICHAAQYTQEGLLFLLKYAFRKHTVYHIISPGEPETKKLLRYRIVFFLGHLRPVEHWSLWTSPGAGRQEGLYLLLEVAKCLHRPVQGAIRLICLVTLTLYVILKQPYKIKNVRICLPFILEGR